MNTKILIILTMLLSTFSAQALDVGDDAPCVVLEHVETDGKSSEHCIRDPKIELKPVVLDFFSIYCNYCIESFPVLNKLSESVAGQATFRAIAIDRKENEVRDFIATRKDLITHEVGLDLDRDAKKAYAVVTTPTIFVLNSQNKIIFKHSGLVTEKISEKIKQVIQSVQ